MDMPVSFNELISEAEKYKLYNQLIKQLNKDLALANLDLSFDEDVLPSSLKLMLHETVYKLIQEQFMSYLNLLYIIDVSERKIKSLDGTDTLEMSEQVTFMILQREWQKVWYKNQYNS